MDLIKRIRERFKRGWEMVVNRVNLWTRKGASHHTTGHVTEKKIPGVEEKRYVWILGNTEQHCTDCLRLNGKVLTSSEWRKIGIRPQSPDLECGGWNCDCRLELTNQPSVGINSI